MIYPQGVCVKKEFLREGVILIKTQYAIPNALAVTTAIVFVLCRVLVGMFPDLFFTVAQSWFHGIELNRIDVGNLTLDSFVLGIVSSTITVWVIGYIFVRAYRLLTK